VEFNRFGLSFQYPDNWAVDVSDAAGRHAAVTVHSPDGGFWSVSGHAAGGPPDTLARAVLGQMREEYRDLDAEPGVDEVAGHVLPGFDMNFYCLDLTNTARVRTLATPRVIYLIFCQAEDREWDRIAPVFAAMTASLVAGMAGPPGRTAARGDRPGSAPAPDA
jgi:hypothetical protein